MIAKAGERRDDFHSDWSQDLIYWRSVDFSVSVPAVKHVGNPARYEQKLWLEPKVELPWDTAFYVWRPALQDDKDENYHIQIDYHLWDGIQLLVEYGQGGG